MPLHPQAQAMIDTYTAANRLDYTTLTARDFRAAFEIPTPVARSAELADIEDRVIEGAVGPMRLRIYRPRGKAPFPMTLYLHGGGFVIGNPETTDCICRHLAASAGSVVLSPDYRLAPEAPFPCGLDDAWSALLWVHAHAEELGGIASKLAVAGDSSGGNFAAVLAQMARDRGLPLRHQLLLYPVMDACFDTPSYTQYASGYFLTAAAMRWFWRQYLPYPEAAADWRASPLKRADLRGVAPATVLTAEYDVLRDEAETYAKRLTEAAVPVSVHRWPGQIHGFLLQQGAMDDADIAVAQAARALRAALC